jgi:hypothetical protein
MKYVIYFSLLLLTAISACKKDAGPDYVFKDSLVTNNQTWLIDSGSISIRKFTQGHYSIRVDSPATLSWSLAPYSNINFPYTVQVDGTPLLDNTNQTGGFAIVFNYTDDNDFDVAEVLTNGTYRIWQKTNGSNSTLVNYTVSAAITPGSGSINTIKVIQNQSSMQLLVNGISLCTFNITLPSSLIQTGPAAIAIGQPLFTPVTTLFNNFSIAKN